MVDRLQIACGSAPVRGHHFAQQQHGSYKAWQYVISKTTNYFEVKNMLESNHPNDDYKYF